MANVVELADIVRRHGSSYLENRPNLSVQQQRALADIAGCHTNQMGGICRFCPKCGSSQFVGYSCRNRACPRCHGKHAQRWLTARMAELLPIPYFHVVFTMPATLHSLVRANPERLLALFVRCCARTIVKLASDHKWIGGQPALLTVLHTARRDLGYHPHVHCLVSAGGYDHAHHQWVAPNKPNFLFPQAALGRIARQKFLDGIRSEMPNCTLPKGVYKCDWVVHCEGSHADSSHIVRYLARYVFRLPLSNGRILQADDQKIVYRYRPNASPHDKLFTTTPYGFLDRYLQHVLPKGFHAVRYWGLWTPRQRPLLKRLQWSLCIEQRLDQLTAKSEAVEPVVSKPDLKHCLYCGTPVEYAQVPAQAAKRLSPRVRLRQCAANLTNAPP